MRDCETSLGTRQLPAPPKAAEHFFRLFLSGADRDPILGDLVEMFQDAILPNRTPRGAKIWYWRQVLRSVVVVLWIRLSRFVRQLGSGFGFLGTLGRGIAGYYLVFLLFHLYLQLPIICLALVGRGYRFSGIGVSGGFVRFEFKLRAPVSADWQNLFQYWEHFVGPLALILFCALALRRSKGWPVLLGAYLSIAAASCCLMPCALSLIVSRGGPSVPDSLDGTGLLLRTGLALLIFALTLAGIYAMSRRLMWGDNQTVIAHLQFFLCRFLLPAVFVSLLYATYFFSRWDSWFIEYYAVMLLPALLIVALASLASSRPSSRSKPIASILNA